MSESTTVILKLQSGFDFLPHASVASKVTVVVPIGNEEPEASPAIWATLTGSVH